MTQFQIILTSIFGVFILVGVVLFANFKNNQIGDSIGDVVIWGTFDEKIVKELLRDLVERDENFEGVSYVQKEEFEFDSILAEAMSEGRGPDLFLLPQSKIIKHEKKIVPITYDAFSARDFKDYFIEEGELYLKKSGILALPLIIDPLVMYWNRTTFTREGIAEPPRYWDSFFTFAKDITKIDDKKNILTSAVALGEYGNINNAKEILASLIMQTGNPIVVREDDGEDIEVVLKEELENKVIATESALRFYTEFSNPVKETYSWNQSIQNSKTVFLSGDLAVYFGFAGEYADLKDKNPNLNFDVVLLPQVNSLKNPLTFGHMLGLAISKESENIVGAYSTAVALIKRDSLVYLSELTNLPPVSRMLLIDRPEDPYQDVFYRSALLSKGFLEVDDEGTDLIFQDMVESVVSGRRKLSEAVTRADAEMTELLK